MISLYLVLIEYIKSISKKELPIFQKTILGEKLLEKEKSVIIFLLDETKTIMSITDESKLEISLQIKDSLIRLKEEIKLYEKWELENVMYWLNIMIISDK